MRRQNRRSLYVALLMLGVLAGAPWAVTQAVWGDGQDVTNNAFSTGSVDINATPASALLTMSDMAPGDVVTAPLAVANDGTLDLRYAMTTSVTGSATLASGLTLEVRSGVAACTNAGFGASGSSLYSGTLSGGAIGDATQGADTGDRTLSAGSGEDLCFQAALPLGASSTLQGLSTTATFSFAAEQVANN